MRAFNLPFLLLLLSDGRQKIIIHAFQTYKTFVNNKKFRSENAHHYVAAREEQYPYVTSFDKSKIKNNNTSNSYDEDNDDNKNLMSSSTHNKRKQQQQLSSTITRQRDNNNSKKKKLTGYYNNNNNHRREMSVHIIRDCATLEELFDLVQKNRLQSFHISFCWNQASRLICFDKIERQKLMRGDDDDSEIQLLLPFLIEQTIQRSYDFNSRSLVAIVHAIAKIYSNTKLDMLEKDNNNKLWQTLEDRIMTRIDSYTAQESSNLLWSFAKVAKKKHSSSSKIFDLEMTERIIEQLDTFDSYSISNTIWAYATTGNSNPRLFDAVAEKIITRTTTNNNNNNSNAPRMLFLESFDSQHMSRTVWAFTKVGHSAPQLFDAISDMILLTTSKFDKKVSSQSISITLWAYAKASGYNNNYCSTTTTEELFNTMTKLIIKILPTFTSQNIANTVWAYAKVFRNDNDGTKKRLFDEIADYVIKTKILHTFNSQELSNTVWAYAKLGYHHPQLFHAIARTSIPKLDTFYPQGISNTIWAYATVNHKDVPDLFDAIAQTLVKNNNRILEKLNSQELSNVLWAFATVNHPVPDLLDAISEQVAGNEKLLASYNPQDISNTVWSYATMNHVAPTLFNSMAQAATQKLEMFNAQALSNTLWAYATVGHEAPELFDAVTIHIQHRKDPNRFLDTMKSQDMSTLVWAYAKVGHVAPDLFDAVSQTICHNNDGLFFTSHSISNTLWAYATSKNKSPELFDIMTPKILRKLPAFSSQDISNTIWAYATSSHYAATDLFDTVIQRRIQLQQGQNIAIRKLLNNTIL